MKIRKLTLSLLRDFRESGKYVNLSLSSHLADNLSQDELRLVTSLLYTTVERRITYDYYIGAASGRSLSDIDPVTLDILRLGACQIVDMSSIPEYAAVNLTVELARNKGERAFLNAVLRKLARDHKSGTLPLPSPERNFARYLSVKYSFPLFTAKHFISLYGKSGAEKIFTHFNENKYTDLTVNTLKLSRDELIHNLNEIGLAAGSSPLSSLSVRIPNSVNPTSLPGFSEGHFFVQDAAGALSAEALGTLPGDSVIDVCACPGGKSFAAAILAEDRGRFVSFDIHESKLSLVISGALRLGLSSLSAGVRDATKPQSDLFGSFDRVICDVPCSGLGVLGKKPDIRHKDPSCLTDLVPIQYSILESSAAYLKTGGYILYSTCTLNPLENEKNVERFLAEHPEFTPCDFQVGEKHSSLGMMTLLPHIDGCDGFFIAKMRKIK